MKRIIAFALSLTMILSLTGCSFAKGFRNLSDAVTGNIGTPQDNTSVLDTEPEKLPASFNENLEKIVDVYGRYENGTERSTAFRKIMDKEQEMISPALISGGVLFEKQDDFDGDGEKEQFIGIYTLDGVVIFEMFELSAEGVTASGYYESQVANLYVGGDSTNLYQVYLKTVDKGIYIIERAVSYSSLIADGAEYTTYINSYGGSEFKQEFSYSVCGSDFSDMKYDDQIKELKKIGFAKSAEKFDYTCKLDINAEKLKSILCVFGENNLIVEDRKGGYIWDEIEKYLNDGDLTHLNEFKYGFYDSDRSCEKAGHDIADL